MTLTDTTTILFYLYLAVFFFLTGSLQHIFCCCLFERHVREVSSVFWFTPWKPATARAGSQELGTQSRSPMGEARTEYLASAAASSVCVRDGWAGKCMQDLNPAASLGRGHPCSIFCRAKGPSLLACFIAAHGERTPSVSTADCVSKAYRLHCCLTVVNVTFILGKCLIASKLFNSLTQDVKGYTPECFCKSF